MNYWYEGNLNENVNRREKDGVIYYIRGMREVDGHRMERYGIHTHFVEEGESYIRLIQDYVMPLYQPQRKGYCHVPGKYSAYGGCGGWLAGTGFKSVWP